jgi:hypothetical protein
LIRVVLARQTGLIGEEIRDLFFSFSLEMENIWVAAGDGDLVGTAEYCGAVRR